MTRFSFLIATLVFAAQLVAARKVALLLTDVKFDDKLTIQVALKEYDHVIAAINAVTDQTAAHGDLLDFLSKMNPSGDYKSKLTVLRGANIKGEAVSHEVNFIKPSQEIMDEIEVLPYMENIDKLLKSDDELDIFQIAPTHREYVNHIAAMERVKKNTNLYHLVHGFNSGQKHGDGPKETLEFVANIGPKFPSAKVVFTNNHASFINGAGSSQPYAKFLNGRVPLDHLEAAVNDPFHVKQLTNAARLLDQAKLIIVVNQLKRAARESNLGSKLESAEFPLADLPKHVYLAATNDEAARTHCLAFLDAVKDKMLPSLATHVREFLNGKLPLKSVYMKAINGELTMDKLYGDEDWLAELKAVEAVVEVKKGDAAVEMVQEETKEEKTEEEKNLEDVLYNAKNPIVKELSEKEYKLEGLSDIVLRARKNLEGEVSQNMRTMLLAYHEALTPIVVDLFHPNTRGSMAFRWKKVVPKAFEGEMTVEVCDANHVLVVRRALELQGPALEGSASRLMEMMMEEVVEPMRLISGQGLSIVDESTEVYALLNKMTDLKKLAKFEFKDKIMEVSKNNVLFAPAKKGSEWGQTLEGLTAEQSFELLDKYLLPAKKAAVSMVVDPVEQVRSLKKRRLF